MQFESRCPNVYDSPMNQKSQLRPFFLGLTCLFFLTCLICTASVSAQQSEVDAALRLLRAMDKNGDGQLESSEIPRRSRPEVAKIAKRAGIDSSGPIPIDTLKKQLRQESKNKKKDADSSSKEGTEKAAPRSRGFGRPQASTAGSSRATSSAGKESSKSSKDDSKKEKEDDRRTARVRAYAQSLMKQFDKNKNGVLDKEEWSKMRGNPGESDVNKDGKLTVDELTARLSSYSRRSSSRGGWFSRSRSRESSSSSTRRKSGGDQKQSYRFLTPTERLSESMPRGLRETFLKADKNGDGQIAMDEFASFWSKSKVEEFTDLDYNNDGVITPLEYVAAKTDSD